MYRLIIPKCTKPLQGNIIVGGAKNSALPIIAASLLTEEACVLERIPNSSDIISMCDLIKFIGAEVEMDVNKGRITINAKNIYNTTAPYELVNKIRASFLIMGPLVARKGNAIIPLPGGCAIGTRPINLHLKGMVAMGAKINQTHGCVDIKTSSRLIGNKIYLDFPSVGATENIMMASTLAKGQTIIENAATEPEIVDLATYLNAMGAKVKGAGTDTIKITGVRSLKGITHSIIPDRIEAGTLMIAAAMTGGNVIIHDIVSDHLKPITAKLKEIGVEVSEELSSVRINASNGILKAADVKTLPYPGFPTDMQSQITALLSLTAGTSMVIETIFENRFMYVSELKRMGANIKIEGRSAIVEGSPRLTGAKIKATDLRAGAALILAGLVADGITELSNVEHIDRGYDRLDLKLNSLGANIQRAAVSDIIDLCE